MKTAVKGGERTEAQPFVPSEEWIEAFEAQLAESELIGAANRYARMRARMVAHAGRKVDDLYARELVQDALDDTLEGVLAWDPSRVTLRKHVLDAIKSRTRHDYVQATKFRHDSLDVSLAAAETALAAQHQEEATDLAGRVIESLRVLAVADADVLRLLDAYDKDAIKKVDVLRVSELTSKRYEAARKRMRRLVLQLPPELQGAARTRS